MDDLCGWMVSGPGQFPEYLRALMGDFQACISAGPFKGFQVISSITALIRPFFHILTLRLNRNS